MKRKHVGISVGVAVMAVAVAWVVYRWLRSGFSWSRFTDALVGVHWRWLMAALAMILLSYVGRALRWEIMLRPLSREISLWRVFTGTAIGFTATVLFGRAGEPVRPYLIAKSHALPFSTQVAAWLVERILDLLMILLFFGFALTQVHQAALQPGPALSFTLQIGGYLVGIVGAFSLVLLIGMRHFHGRVRERIVEGLGFLPDQIVGRVNTFLAAFEEGMKATRSAGFALLLAVLTVVEWVVIAACFACVARAFPATGAFTPADVVILLGFVAMGSVVQIPGVGGGMQLVTIVVLTELFGLPIETASGFALVLWLVNYVSIVPLGLIFAFHEGLHWRNLRHLNVLTETNT